MAMVYHRKYERDTLWQSRNGAFDFPHFSGDLSPTIQDPATLLDVFIIATIQQNLGRNECRGIPRRSVFASIPDYRVCYLRGLSHCHFQMPL